MADIIHSVAFTLVHEPGSAGEEAFLADGRRILTGIPGVRDFQVLRQVSGKNPYRFGFTMRFASNAAYEAYNAHPAHVAFVRDRWQKEVAAFLENDSLELPAGGGSAGHAPDQLLAQMRNHQPQAGHLGFWWFGQMGFGIKLAGRLIFLDAFLSPHPGRNIPPAVDVHAAQSADIIFGTHDHIDHIDRDAWRHIARASSATRFVVPLVHRAGVAADLGVPEDRVIGVDEERPATVDGITIRAVASAHEFLDTDPSTGLHPHLGFVLEADGLRLYHAGDCCMYEGLQAKLRALGPLDAMFVPINGRDGVRYRRHLIGNMTAQEAVDLVGAIRPRLAIPGHYEMFDGNRGDPGLFADYLDAKYPGLACWVGPHFVRVDL